MPTHSQHSGHVCFSDEPMKVFPISAPEAGMHTTRVEVAITSSKEEAKAEHVGTPTSSQAIEPGAVVQFHGLTLTTTLNGIFGVVDRWHAKKQQWVVVTEDGRDIVANASNLKVIMAKGPFAIGCPPGLSRPSPRAQPPMTFPFPWPSQHAVGYTFEKRETRCHQKSHANGRGFATACTSALKPTSSFGSDTTAFAENSASDTSSESEVETVAPKASSQTTVMLRGIPNDFTRDLLVDLLDSQDFSGCYNFVYLPIDIQTEAACGYAIIALFTHGEAERLRKHFDGFTQWPVASEKVCQTSWNSLDGLLSHVERFRNSPFQHESVPDKFKPALFNKFGKRVPFPSPTKKIHPPRFAAFASKSAPPSGC